MRIDKILEECYNEFLLIKEDPTGYILDMNGEGFFNSDFVKTLNEYKLDKNTKLVEGCYPIIDKRRCIVEGVFGERYEEFFYLKIGETKILISVSNAYSGSFEVVGQAPELIEVKEEANYDVELAPQGQTVNSGFTNQEVYIDNEPVEEIQEESFLEKLQREKEEKKALDDAKYVKQDINFSKVFDILHEDCFMEKSIKLSLHNDLFWDVWSRKVKSKHSEQLFKNWCNQENKDFDNLNPLEYGYIKIIEIGCSEEDVLKELKEYLDKAID